MPNFVPEPTVPARDVQEGIEVYFPRARRYMRIQTPIPSPTPDSVITSIEQMLQLAHEGEFDQVSLLCRNVDLASEAVHRGSAGKIRLRAGMGWWDVAPDELVAVRNPKLPRAPFEVVGKRVYDVNSDELERSPIE